MKSSQLEFKLHLDIEGTIPRKEIKLIWFFRSVNNGKQWTLFRIDYFD